MGPQRAGTRPGRFPAHSSSNSQARPLFARRSPQRSLNHRFKSLTAAAEAFAVPQDVREAVRVLYVLARSFSQVARPAKQASLLDTATVAADELPAGSATMRAAFFASTWAAYQWAGSAGSQATTKLGRFCLVNQDSVGPRRARPCGVNFDSTRPENALRRSMVTVNLSLVPARSSPRGVRR